MSTIVKKTEIKFLNWKVNTFIFLPGDNTPIKPIVGLMTHGYSSHKGSILSWPTRLAEEGMPCVLFDLPGHYLGSYNEISHFEEFKKNSFLLFNSAFDLIKKDLPVINNLVLLGHSLGGFLALKALENFDWDIRTTAIVVGLGKSKEDSPPQDIFHTPFYKSVLKIRAQLVSPELPPTKILNWVRTDIHKLKLSNQNIHLITGKDDIIIGHKGMERLHQHLKDLGNLPTMEKPNHLPHQLPELAAPFIKKYLKNKNLI